MNARLATFVRIVLEAAVVGAVVFGAIVAVGIYNLSWFSPQVPSANSPADLGLDYENVKFRTADGVEIAGWFMRGGEADGRSAIVVLSDFSLDKGAVLPHVAFLSGKFSLLAVDFRRTGESQCVPFTFGAREANDLDAAVSWLKSRGYANIGVYGFGFGGSVALSGIARNSDIKAVVSEGAFANLRDAMHEPFLPFGPAHDVFVAASAGALKTFLHADVDVASPLRALPGCDRPVLVINAANDPVSPLTNAYAIRAVLGEDGHAEFWFPDTAVHGEGDGELAVRTEAFFEEYLK